MSRSGGSCDGRSTDAEVPIPGRTGPSELDYLTDDVRLGFLYYLESGYVD